MQADDLRGSVPSTVQPLSLGELGNLSNSGAPQVLATANPLHLVKARLTVCLGSAELTVGELLKAREHQVLRLDRTIDQPVDILLEGQIIARGVLVAVDDHFGVKITELPQSLTP